MEETIPVTAPGPDQGSFQMSWITAAAGVSDGFTQGVSSWIRDTAISLTAGTTTKYRRYHQRDHDTPTATPPTVPRSNLNVSLVLEHFTVNCTLALV